MPVTIENKVPDLTVRDAVNAEIQAALQSTQYDWHVKILPSQNNDDWELRVYGPDNREFSTILVGSEGHHQPEFVRGQIQKAIASVSAVGISSAKEALLKKFRLLSGTSAGIETWITEKTDDQVFHRLSRIDSDPLSKVQLNQLFLLAHEAGVSDGFFKYYWLSCPHHPYDNGSIPGFNPQWMGGTSIQSIEHLIWGLYRLYVDALLFFGNIRSGYRFLRSKTQEEIETFFRSKCFDTDAIKRRGPSLSLAEIPKDNRYLISEMACKSYDSAPAEPAALKKALVEALSDYQKRVPGGRISIGSLLDGTYVKQTYADTQKELVFSADDILKEEVSSPEELDTKYAAILKKFNVARDAALLNTRFYLSMVNDLDVYVATSMRTRQDFRNMADSCEVIFADKRLKQLEIRYFDPTLSAAEGHEDKGLIECLMVRCAKALVYCAGEKESYGKDAEAAMALSLGKPVIFFCDASPKGKFYRDVHPLSRLIDFETGVAVGAIVATKLSTVSDLLYRIFENKMEYELVHPKPGYFRLKEKLTGSVVRVQTSDTLLRETFWNYYHNRPDDGL